jgi:DNA-binding NtrC family response regulator
MRILVMDDYQSHGEGLAEFLGSRGYEAIYAASYADAEWLLALMRFDLAVLDFDMPGLPGPAVAAKLAERFPQLRSVIMSARPPSGPRKAELGSFLFLEKPVPTDALLEIVGRVEKEIAGFSVVLRSVFSVVKYK